MSRKKNNNKNKRTLSHVCGGDDDGEIGQRNVLHRHAVWPDNGTPRRCAAADDA